LALLGQSRIGCMPWEDQNHKVTKILISNLKWQIKIEKGENTLIKIGENYVFLVLKS
jgi:hypothetical protein